MLEVMEPLAPKFGDKPSIPIGCNRLQPIGKFGVSTVLLVKGDMDGLELAHLPLTFGKLNLKEFHFQK